MEGCKDCKKKDAKIKKLEKEIKHFEEEIMPGYRLAYEPRGPLMKIKILSKEPIKITASGGNGASSHD